MEATTETEKAREDLLCDVLGDVRNLLLQLCYKYELNPKLRFGVVTQMYVHCSGNF